MDSHAPGEGEKEGMAKKWRREKKEKKEEEKAKVDVDDIGIVKMSYYLTKVGVLVATGNAHKTSLPRQ